MTFLTRISLRDVWVCLRDVEASLPNMIAFLERKALFAMQRRPLLNALVRLELAFRFFYTNIFLTILSSALPQVINQMLW